MMLRLLAPEWLFLLPLLALAGWKYSFLRLHAPVRAAALIAFILALAHPVFNKGGSEMDLWVMVDQSNSTGGIPANQSTELQAILEKAKRPGDRVRLVDFAGEAILRGKGDPVFSSMIPGTRMEDAISYILAQMDRTRTNRILMLTDGYSTQPLDVITARLIEEKVPLDYRLAAPDMSDDIRIGDIQRPPRIRPGEAATLTFDIIGNPAQNTTVPWKVVKNGGSTISGTATLDKGRATVRLTDRSATPGIVSYDISVLPANDTVTLNNTAECVMEITGGNKILLLSPFESDPMEPFLRAQGFDILRPNDPLRLNANSLTGVGLVIVNNVSAAEVSPDFLKGLDFYVREQGGGFLICGGSNSFGSGGYFNSPVDELLPVSMELKNDKIKLMTAMSIVLDRSGSMAMSAGSGGKTKMDLANSGVVQTIKLLGQEDYVSVHAIDSSPHAIVSMCNVGANRDKMLSVVPRIESMGGGIFIGEALRAGWRQLKQTDFGNRHLILFADAADSEEPDDYKKTLADMRKNGATVSVIALGTPKDGDANLLKEIAKLGEGRIFFCDNPKDIPHVFAQETVSVARATFIRENTPLHSVAGWNQISPARMEWPTSVNAYNLCYLRDGATAACITGDTYKAPLVAFWNRGSGRSAAITFPTGGKYAANVLAWKNYGDFIQTFARWLIRRDMPEGFSVRATMRGERLDVELLYSDEAVLQMAKRMPELIMNVTGKQMSKTVKGVWEHIRPGVFRCSFPAAHGETWRGAIRIGDRNIPFGPISMSMDPEWTMTPESKLDFLSMVRQSGGQERIDLTSIMQSPRNISSLDTRNGLIWAFLILMLADALLTRLNISLLPGKKNGRQDHDDIRIETV